MKFSRALLHGLSTCDDVHKNQVRLEKFTNFFKEVFYLSSFGLHFFLILRSMWRMAIVSLSFNFSQTKHVINFNNGYIIVTSNVLIGKEKTYYHNE